MIIPTGGSFYPTEEKTRKTHRVGNQGQDYYNGTSGTTLEDWVLGSGLV